MSKPTYLQHSDYPESIEAAEEELLLHACDLIRPDEVQDARQRWKNAAAEIIATKNYRYAALLASHKRLAE